MPKPRSCGQCRACCTSLAIAALDKAMYEPCKHLAEAPMKGCSIYETRPQDCREWSCAWLLGQVDDPHLRPDRCGVVMSIRKTERYGNVWCLWTTETDEQFDSADVSNIIATLLSLRQTVCLIFRDGSKQFMRDGDDGFYERVPGPLRLPVLQEKPK